MTTPTVHAIYEEAHIMMNSFATYVHTVAIYSGMRNCLNNEWNGFFNLILSIY